MNKPGEALEVIPRGAGAHRTLGAGRGTGMLLGYVKGSGEGSGRAPPVMVCRNTQAIVILQVLAAFWLWAHSGSEGSAG